MNRIMLDLETMGQKHDAAIIAIGAVRFDEVMTLDSFHVIVDLSTATDVGLSIDADTVLWWLRQDDAARGQFTGRSTSLKDALNMFALWVGDDAEIWGNGADFDNAILASAYLKCGKKRPWKYFNNRCYRTLKNLFPQVKEKKFKGVKHCAVDDAQNQAEHLLEIVKLLDVRGLSL